MDLSPGVVDKRYTGTLSSVATRLHQPCQARIDDSVGQLLSPAPVNPRRGIFDDDSIPIRLTGQLLVGVHSAAHGIPNVGISFR